jgi:hypothetical protein
MPQPFVVSKHDFGPSGFNWYDDQMNQSSLQEYN